MPNITNIFEIYNFTAEKRCRTNGSINIIFVHFCRSFIQKLPDKGEKISKFRSQLLEVLSQREDIEKACELFSRLKIGKPSVSDELEWTGKHSQTSHESGSLDSDDESDEDRNPLKILATQSGVGTYKKQHKIEEPDESLIKPEDLKDIECSVTNGIEGSEQDGNAYVKHLCDKFEKPKEKKKEPFRPYRLAKVNSEGQSPNSLQVKKPLGPHWEVTAATPPQPIFGDVKLISLQESFQLQKEQATKLKVSIIMYNSDKFYTTFFLLSFSTLRSALRHSAIVFDNHKRWHVGDISSDIPPI